MKVAIIGCGLIGRKRAQALSENDQLVACCDVDKSIVEKFAADFFCNSYTDYKILFQNEDFDIIVVAVVNKYAKDIIISALNFGKYVLAEKPLGRNVIEAEDMISAKQQARKSLVFKTGFNHRFHPAIWQAKKVVDSGKIGDVFSIRARYGHGGRPGMEKEWRASKDLCGGGELLDQGVHVIDLIRWFGGDISEVYGKVETKFWNISVEDSAFAVLKTKKDVTASFHVSWTNWKNIFSFEVFGTDGYIRVEGLGGSYGPETLEVGIRKKEGGRPDIELFEFPAEDISWKNEWCELKTAINERREVIGNDYDGLMANKIVEALYLSNQKKQPVSLKS